VEAAVELARQHGVIFRRAAAYGWIYGAEESGSGRTFKPPAKGAQAAFVELIAPPRAALEECVIGVRVLARSQDAYPGKASAPPDWDRPAARLAGNGRMIQITPQMRIWWQWSRSTSGKHRIRAELCRRSWTPIHFRVTCSCSAAGEQPLLRCWSMTGRDSGWRRSVYRRTLPLVASTERRSGGTGAVLRAHQAQVLLRQATRTSMPAPVGMAVKSELITYLLAF